MGEAHDVHGLHGLLEVVFVLLARDWDVTVGQEAVVVESFQKQVRCWQKMEKHLEKHGQYDFLFFFISKEKALWTNKWLSFSATDINQ